MSGQQSSPKTPDGQRRRTGAVCLGLTAITLAVFGQTLAHEFVNYDDDLYVYDNPIVEQGLTFKGTVWAFTSSHASNWHPLTWLSHMLDCQLYGLNPAGHHLTNVLLHTAAVIALFLVLRQMTGAFWRSAFVAAVFAVHPLRAESVAWVAERKDVLSGLFFMLTIGAYVRYARLPWSPVRYGLVMLLFALGLMCKPMLVTLPLVLLLFDYWPLKRLESTGKLALEKLPLLALSAAGCMATLLAQNQAIQSAGSYSLALRLGNGLVSCMIYLGQMVYPAGLAVLYPFPHDGAPTMEVALAVALLVGLSAVAWARRHTQPWLLVGWLWYLVMLLPVLGIIQVGGQAHADRYTYLPQIGIYVALTWLVEGQGAKWQTGRMALGGITAGVLAVLMVCAWRQTSSWKNSETMWNHTLDCTKDNYIAYDHLAEALRAKGSTDEAIFNYQKALQIKPDYAEVHNNIGILFAQKESAGEAIDHFQKAVQIRPDYAEAQNNLGNVLLQQGRVDEGIDRFQKALHIKPDYADACNNLGSALLQKGKLDEAIPILQRALQIDPDDAKAHNNLGNALLQKGNTAEAIAHFRQAVQIEPSDPAAQNNLAWLLATSPQASLRNGDEAVERAQQANALTGEENPIVLRTLAAALAEAGRFPEAVEIAQHALPLARAQSNPVLCGQLESDVKLYQAGNPVHTPEQTH
jgi:Flp pilus assembly protein TadD